MQLNFLKVDGKYYQNNIARYALNAINSPKGYVSIGIGIIALFIPLFLPFVPKNFPWKPLLENISSDLLGTVLAVIGFDFIAHSWQDLEKQRGIEVSGFNHYDFVKNIQYSQGQQVLIMDTWAILFEDSPFFEQVKDVLVDGINLNNLEVQVLLLNPENTALVEARAKEINNFDVDVEKEIYINLRSLQIIKAALKTEKAHKLEIRLFNNTPSLAMYLCPPSMVVTFFRLGQFSSSGKQLQILLDSPVGEFIRDRFNEIWNGESSRSMDDYLSIDVEIPELRKTFSVRYIHNQEGFWIQSTRMYMQIAPYLPDIHVCFAGNVYTPTPMHQNDLPLRVQNLFTYKYPRFGEDFLFLETDK